MTVQDQILKARWLQRGDEAQAKGHSSRAIFWYMKANSIKD